MRVPPRAPATVAISFQPAGRQGNFPRGVALLEAARRLGLGLSNLCGGAGLCGACQVIVPPAAQAALTPPTAVERERLGKAALQSGARLACQAHALADLHVLIPPPSLITAQRTQIEGRQTAVALDPPVRPCDVALPPPALDDPRADSARLRAALGQAVRIDLALLQELPARLRTQNGQARAVLRGDWLVALLPPGAPLLGLAFDLGTTKLAGYLLDLESGQTLATAGAMNPQLAYGEDVIARIAWAMQEEEGGRQLQEAAAEGLAGLTAALCAQAGVAADGVVEAVVVGNTAMHHLFLGLPVDSLGLSPYTAVEDQALDVPARQVGLPLAPGAMVHLLPNIAGFVGADHVAALLATRLDEAAAPTLLLDIGTNTEISLAAGGRLLCCSAASGPAFEGAHISAGMRAAPGAIERLRIVAGRVMWETVDGQPPAGLCGSGILDAVAQLRQAGLLDERGAFAAGETAFVLVAAKDAAHGEPVAISRQDVSRIQLAKAAIAAGWQVLLQEAGLRQDALARVLVAGAFGSYLDIASAVAIGMLPALPAERFEQVGNVAGTGARMALLSQAERQRAARLARQVEYIELATHPHFRQTFSRSLPLTAASVGASG